MRRKKSLKYIFILNIVLILFLGNISYVINANQNENDKELNILFKKIVNVIQVEKLDNKKIEHSVYWFLNDKKQGFGLKELQIKDFTFVDEKVRLEIILTNEEYLDSIKEFSEDVVVENYYKSLVQVLVPIDLIHNLSEENYVQFIRKPLICQPYVISEGVGVIKADLVQVNGYYGNGVKIAVIDLGFEDYDINPDIPFNRIVEAISYRAGYGIKDGGPHGSACTELVLDVAPLADLYLYSCGTISEFNSAVNRAISKNVDIITFSAGWIGINDYDGKGEVCNIVNNARSKDILFVVAAGNEAEGHYEGVFTDKDGDFFHEFGGQIETLSLGYLPSYSFVHLILSWNDWPKSNQDYDLILVDNDLNIVGYSGNVQSGSQPPVEGIFGYTPYGDFYYVIILEYDATRSVHFELYSSYNNFYTYNHPESSLSCPADASGAMTVGATNWQNDNLESFSSRGPTNDGRTKPDVVSPDRVSTWTYGPNNFPGTSASTPHVAGAAALLKSVDPTLTANELQNKLESTALDFGSSGKDNLYGSGRINVWNAYNTINQPPIANNDYYSVNEDDSLIVLKPGVINNDTDPNGDTLIANLVSSVSHGALTFNSDGSFIYKANSNYFGSDSFTYKVNDGTYNSNIATVFISVKPKNDKPTAKNDYYTINEDNTINILAPGVLANDTDIENDPLNAILINEPINGQLTSFTAGGSFIYTPYKNFFGNDNFNYIANDSFSDSNIATVYITVNPVNDLPNASFIYNPAKPNTSDIIQFTDMSTDTEGPIVYWNWNFGDGNIISEQNPTHQYTDDGTYTIILNVSDNEGATDKTVKQITVTNVVPIADFQYTPINPIVGDIVQFTDLSNDVDGNIVNWTWDFGDGGSLKYSQNPSHIFTSSDSYSVKLTVKDNDGDIDSIEKIVNVETIPPIANFTYEPQEPIEQEIVYFNSTSFDQDGNIVNWTWDLGDGNYTYAEFIKHFYPEKGKYSVTLTVKDNNGATDSKIKIIEVFEPPFLYNISGKIYYNGSKNGTIYIGLFEDYPGEESVPSYIINISSLDNYNFQAPNGTYYLGAFMDINKDRIFDNREPLGFAINKSFGEKIDEIIVNGKNVDEVNINLFDWYNISGTIYYKGTANQPIYIMVYSQYPSEGTPLIINISVSSPGGYTLSVPDGLYYLYGFMDINGDFVPDIYSEPIGFAINNTFLDGAEVIEVNEENVEDVDIILYAPPIVSDIPNLGINEGETFTTFDLDDYVDDDDNNDDELTWTYFGNTDLLVVIDNEHIVDITTPDSDWFGSETIVFKVNDPDGLFDSDNATFTVTNINDPPVANDDTAIIDEDSSYNKIDVLINDTDIEGDTLYIKEVTNPINGSGYTDGNYVYYTPNPDYYGYDFFTYTINDSNGGTNQGIITIIVNSVNDPPIVSDIQNDTILEGDSFATFDLDDYVIDIDNDDSEISWFVTGQTDLIVIIDNEHIASITTPDSDWFGTETIFFTAEDTDGLTDSDGAMFIVIPVTEIEISESGTYNISWTYVNVNINVSASTNISFAEYIENPHPEDQPYNTLNKYIDIEAEDWDVVIPPLEIKIFYTQSDLNSANITEDQLAGIYFWDDATNKWQLYNNTGVNTVYSQDGYEGFCWADVWHLTPLGVGGNYKPSAYIDSISPNPAIEGNTVSFIGHGTDIDGIITGYNWRSNINGDLSNQALFTTSDLSTGSHTIYFQVRDDYGDWSDEKSDVLIINTSGGGTGPGPSPSPGGPTLPPPDTNPPPKADAGGPYTEFIGIPITFDGSGSTDDETIDKYNWDFGDETTGIGISPTHTYLEGGNYTVTLKVTDNKGKTDTSSTYALISGLPNNPPTKPIVSGPRSGTKNTNYDFNAMSTDPDNDTIRYIFDWGDGTNSKTEYVPNGTVYTETHNWTTAWIYTIKIYTKDEQNASSEITELTVLIDACFVDDIGFFIDSNGDAVFDTFYSNETVNESLFELQDIGEYNIDINGDGKWDYNYNSLTGTLTSLKVKKETLDDEENTLIYLFVISVVVVLIVLFLITFRYKNRKENAKQNRKVKTPEKKEERIDERKKILEELDKRFK